MFFVFFSLSLSLSFTFRIFPNELVSQQQQRASARANMNSFSATTAAVVACRSGLFRLQLPSSIAYYCNCPASVPVVPVSLTLFLDPPDCSVVVIVVVVVIEVVWMVSKTDNADVA